MNKVLFIPVLAVVISTLYVTAGCSQQEATPFAIDVIPEQLKGHSIAGQHCVFLVTITNEGVASEVPVAVSAAAPGAEVVIHKQTIVEGQVAEVVIIPEKTGVGSTIEVSIKGNRSGLTDERIITFEVVEGEDGLQEYATELRDRFIPWLVASHPELGITGDTEWAGTIVSPQWLIVSHYLFFSEEWEMHLSWHVMISPHDWAKIDLRHRFDETRPSYAFEISSLAASKEPLSIEVPDIVWR